MPVTRRIQQRKETAAAGSEGAGGAAGGLSPSKPSGKLLAIDAAIEEKRQQLEAIQVRQPELQEQMRLLDKADKEAADTSSGGQNWDKSETQRFMESLLKAQRSRKAKEA